jgi:hypothetical protein
MEIVASSIPAAGARRRSQRHQSRAGNRSAERRRPHRGGDSCLKPRSAKRGCGEFESPSRRGALRAVRAALSSSGERLPAAAALLFRFLGLLVKDHACIRDRRIELIGHATIIP